MNLVNRKRRVSRALLLLVLSLPLLVGCWDQRELAQIGLVLAVGIDKGKMATYAVTVLIALPSKMAGGGSGGTAPGGATDKPYLTVEVESSTISGALSILNASIDRRVSLIHTKTLLISEELARSSAMIVMDEFVRFGEARRNVALVVTKERASEFLDKIDVKTAKEPSRYFEEMENTFAYAGLTPARSLIHDFVTHIHTRYTEPMVLYAAIRPEERDPAVPTADGDDPFWAGKLPMRGLPNVDVVGAAAFRKDRMVGILTGEEVRVILMVQERFRQSLFVVDDPRDPEKSVSLALSRGRPIKVDVDLSGPRPRAKILVTLEAELQGVQTITDYTDPALHRELEHAVEQKLINTLRRVVTKTQDWGSDVMGLGLHVVGRFATVGAWEAYNWPDHYAESEITLEARVKLRRFGLQLSPPLSD